MDNLILDSLEIKGFRAFEHLSIESVSRVNLIVGKNNVGKSCLLEALWLYAHRGSPEVIRDSLIHRDEIGDAYNGRNTEDETFVDALRFLFYGRKILAEHSLIDKFSIGPFENIEKQFSLSAEWYGEEQIDPETNRKIWKPVRQKKFSGSVDVSPGLTIMLGNEVIISSLLSRLFDRPFALLSWSQRVQELACVFVSASGLEDDALAMLWDKIALKPEEEEVVKGLRMIVPDVERLTLIGQSERKRGRIPVVKLHELSEPIPLRSLGEGTNRLFGILLALVNARDGLLLIDEVDSGLHYTVHPNLWRLIFEVAERLNVQVFATTHSWDCIEGFQQNLLDTPDKGMLIRLENRQGHIIPVLFDGARLGIATRQEIEVR